MQYLELKLDKEKEYRKQFQEKVRDLEDRSLREKLPLDLLKEIIKGTWVETEDQLQEYFRTSLM